LWGFDNTVTYLLFPNHITSSKRWKIMQKKLECPFGVPEEECCGSPTCKARKEWLNAQNEAKA